MPAVSNNGTFNFKCLRAAFGLSLVVLTCLSACSTGRHQAYPGVALPDDQIATLATGPQAVPPGAGAGAGWSPSVALVRIIELDGKPGPARAFKDNSVQIDVLPGRHELKVALEAEDWNPISRRHAWIEGKQKAVLQFDAQAGRIYAVRADLVGGLWNALIVDFTENSRKVAFPSRWEN